MDRFTSMEIFVAVVELGSLSAAAKRFGLSAPMVGKHLQHLEQRLGARLLTRTTRRQSLTEVGRHYVERCKEILAEVRAAEAGAEALQASPRGRLRVAAPVAFGAMRMAPALADYLAANPEVSVELMLEDRVVDLVEEGFDAAVRIGRLKDSDFVARPLRAYRMCMCAAPAYLASEGTPQTLADLGRHRRLGFTHWNPQGDWSQLAALMQDDALPRPRLVSNHAAAVHMATLRGAGIAMLGEALVADDLLAGRLVSLLQGLLPPPRPVHLVYPRDRQPVPKLRTFIDFMVARFGDHSVAL
jgi:DNA-binding transcriptional LysR family regulator